jgi:hypothetical protein
MKNSRALRPQAESANQRDRGEVAMIRLLVNRLALPAGMAVRFAASEIATIEIAVVAVHKSVEVMAAVAE